MRSFAQAPSAPERRVAFVVGIGAYQHASKLANPVNDARAIGEALRRLNFEVDEVYDADFRQLSRSLREFGIKAQRADVAVIYYAGHGVQVGRENYLLPADTQLERERDLVYEAMSLDLFLGEISQARKLGIILLDACRNNPFVERLSRSINVATRGPATAGLARVDNVPRNTLVAMATKADQTAEDGGGGHSPFAEALLKNLQTPGLELSLFFRSVRDNVLQATNNTQEPFIFSSLGADPFYFNPRPPNRPPQIGAIPPLEVRDNAGPTRAADPEADRSGPGSAHRAHHRTAARRRGSDRGQAGDPRSGLQCRSLCDGDLQADRKHAGRCGYARHPGGGRPRRQRPGKSAGQYHRLQSTAGGRVASSAADLYRCARHHAAHRPGRRQAVGDRSRPAARPGALWRHHDADR